MKFTSENNQHAGAALNGRKTVMKNGVALTKREKEVLELVAQGLTANEIAEALFVSLDTVETHRKNIIQKMNARNTVNAVVKAMRRGLIE